MNRSASNPITAKELYEGILKQDKKLLSRAITIVESTTEQHQKIAKELIELCLPFQGKAFRISVTGIPGAGKSTFIEAIGNLLLKEGYKIAILAVDPTSSISRGSILGDKTRMEVLSRQENAFIRPSPNRGVLGGVTKNTREVMTIFDAANYDYILVETVGVGQSEISIRWMVDCFILLLIAGAGDELQIFKKGVTELADIILVNKADGENYKNALRYAEDIQRTIHFLDTNNQKFQTSVIPISSKTSLNLLQVWETIKNYQSTLQKSENWKQRIRKQKLDWFHTLLREKISEAIFSHKEIKSEMKKLEEKVINDEILIHEAVERVIARLFK